MLSGPPAHPAIQRDKKALWIANGWAKIGF